eukprot:gene3329-5768_t
MSSLPTICVCGGGSGSHVTAGYLGNKGYKVNVLTRQPEKWNEGIQKNGGMIVHTRKNGETEMSKVVGKINKVSSDAKEVAPEADVFLLGGPAHANPDLLAKIAPYVKKGAFVGALYGQGGFDWAARALLKEKYSDVVVFALQHIPWICTKIVYGQEVRMIGPKKKLSVSCIPISKGEEVAKLCTDLFDINTVTIPNFLCLTLTPSNQIIHPARYYGIFKDWDGKKTYDPKSIPMLYEGMDDFSSDRLQLLNDELQAIKKAFEKRYPKLDLSEVKEIGERIIEQYGSDVSDTSSLKMIFQSNKGYQTVKTPVKVVEGGVIPVVDSRFFVEDLPFGLCILRDLADMLDVKVPIVSESIEWFQQFMNKEYLKNGELNQELIGETGTPRKYGFTDLDDLVKDYF